MLIGQLCEVPDDAESTAICSPSSDQCGFPQGPRDVNCCGFEPSLSQMKISKLPVRFEWKAILFPSGENCGCPSTRVEPINLVAEPIFLLPESGTSRRQMFTQMDSRL